MKTFEEIVLAFLPVESKTNIFYVDINFPGNLFVGFGRYCGKVVPEPTVYHPFFSASIHKECSFNIFFTLAVSKGKNRSNKRESTVTK